MKKPAITQSASGPAGKPRLTTSAMIASIACDGQKTTTAPFGHALVELARTRPDVVGMTADLGKYTDLHIFAKEYPDRFYQMGIAEQNLLGVAAGMATVGFIPFVSTFACFAVWILLRGLALQEDVDVARMRSRANPQSPKSLPN